MGRSFVIVVGVLLFLLVISCIFPLPLEILLRLASGWWFYVVRVVPNVRVDIGGLVMGAASLVAALIIGHSMARWFWRARHGQDWPARRTFAIIAIFMLAFVAGIGATGVAHQATWLARSKRPLLESSSRIGKMSLCGDNLRMIGEEINRFAKAHDGRLPDSFAELIIANDISGHTFICPASDDDWPTDPMPASAAAQLLREDHRCSYVYHGRGLRQDQVSPGRVIACESIANHGLFGLNILYADGTVQEESAERAEQILKTMERPQR